MGIPYYKDIDLNGNELQNAVDQNLTSAPESPVEGQFYWNSSTKQDMIWNGSAWVSRTSDTTYIDFVGADGTNAGAHGLVPAPAATDNVKFLKGDGTWGVPTDTTYTFSTGLTTNGTTISVTDYNKLVKNTATGSDSLNILGISTGYEGSVSIGVDSTAGNHYTTAIGYGAVANGNNSIQLGYGTNSTNFTLSVGFYNTDSTHYNWTLLNGTTGYIPDARLNMDSTPTSASTHTVTSGGVYTALSGKQDASTAVTHTAAMGVGSPTQPVYIPSDGIASPTTYSLAKSVPSDAVFTDTTYTNGTGLGLTGTTFSLNAATSSALGGVIVGTNIGVTDGTISVANASTSTKGVIEIATDTEASAGTSTTLAVTPKQLATKIGLGSLSIDSGSTNYLGYDSTTGKFSASVDTTVGTVSTNLVTSGAVNTALGNKLDKKPDGTNNLIDTNNKITTTYLPDVVLGQLLYAGTFVPSTAVATLTTNAKTKLGTTSNTITLTNDTTAITGYAANEGCYYICSGDGTFASISFVTGDWLLSTGSGWTKVDNTDAVTGVKGNAESTYRTGNVNITADNVMPTQTGNSGKFLTTDGTNVSWASVDAFPSQTGNSGKFLTTNGTTVSWDTAVTPSGTQTLTNKTIDADNNTIQDLTTSNLKSGVLQTTVRAASSASDTALASEKAIATALSAKTTKISATNPALTSTSGVCTWTITNSIGTTDVVVQVFEVSSNTQVFTGVEVTTSNVVISMNSSSNISAGTFRAVIIGI